MDDIFLFNEGLIIAVCGAENPGTGKDFLLSVAPFCEPALRLAEQPPTPRSCLPGFTACSCQALKNVFSSSKNIWSSAEVNCSLQIVSGVAGLLG